MVSAYTVNWETGEIQFSGGDDNAQGLVNEKFREASDYADEAWQLATGFIDALAYDSSFSVPFSSLDYDFPPAPLAASMPTTPDRPNADVVLPDQPQTPTLGEVTLTSVDMPAFDVVSPEITFPDAPVENLPADPGDAPSIGDIVYPTRQDYTLPDAPTIDVLSIPTAPDITLPQFDGERPEVSLTPPVASFVYNEQEYSSDIGSELALQIASELATGSYGLGNDVISEIWTQARARQELKREAMYDEALEFYSARGWNIPPGMMSGRLLEIQKENDRADTVLNAEITIEEARLSNANRQFVFKLILDRENILLGHANSVAQRAFESARFTQEAAIQVFNAQVGRYNLLLDAYKTDAQVYESRIRASLTELEQFKARLEGVKINADIQSKLVELYSVQVGAVETLARVYAAEMEGAKIQADIERVRLDGFRARIDAYTARIGAETAKYNLYQTQISGEVAKVQVYSEQVRAFGARVDASKAQADINIAQSQAQIEQNRLLIEQYKSDLEGYKARVDALVAEVDATAKLYGAEVTGYSAEVEAAKTEIEAQARSFEIQMRHEINSLELMLKEAETNLQGAIAAHEIGVETIKAGANVSAQMAASALSSVNASAQLGFSQSFGTSDGYSHSYDMTRGEPTYHYQYNYQRED